MIDVKLIKKIIKETDGIFFDDNLRKDVFVKGDSDFVTKVDLSISDFLKNKLKELFPNILFQSEEEPFNIMEGKDYWILDPIDGTTNFMHTLPFCCISLALLSKGEIVFGLIYSPYTNELFTAEKGKGAYLNGKKIQCSKYTKLCNTVGLFEFNAYYKNDKNSALIQAEKIYSACQDIRTLGSAALEIAYIACGRADVFLGRYLKPWDYAAGCLLVTEAGGKIADLCGEVTFTELGRHFIATNGLVHDEFISLLKK